MTTENIAAIWLIIGVIYAFINGAVRKIDTDGDWLLPIAWMTLWPITLPAVIGVKIYEKYFEKPSN
jgi:hypothetical protein